MTNNVVELKNITKMFPGVVALDDVNFAIKPGGILGLIGENGAGKSTLIKVLTGAYKPSNGEIYISGKKCQLKNPNDARLNGISCIYQELNIEKDLSVIDNIFINNWKRKSLLLDYKYMNKVAKETMLSLGHDIDVKKPASNYGMGVLQTIEIARAILLNAQLIIMDEPTSSLGVEGIKQLFKTCRELKNRGISIIFVSHKLEEIFEICDRITVMRDGKIIETRDTKEWNNDTLIEAMVGRKLDEKFPKIVCEKKDCKLKVENLTTNGGFYNISFRAYGGQILGLAGLVGAGRTKLVRAIFGADKIEQGKIYINGKKVYIGSPKESIANGLAFLTDDRRGTGLVLDESIKMNLILSSFDKFNRGIFLNYDAIDKSAKHDIERLKIKTSSMNQSVGQLSGGNQQKVVIGKWLNADADIYIFDEPTRGIDVGSKVEIYNVMNDLAKEGKCIIMISSELPEILGMSDEVVVMRQGKIVGSVNRDSKYFNQNDIMKLAWGNKIDKVG